MPPSPKSEDPTWTETAWVYELRLTTVDLKKEVADLKNEKAHLKLTNNSRDMETVDIWERLKTF
jgi:hypothetical protein